MRPLIPESAVHNFRSLGSVRPQLLSIAKPQKTRVKRRRRIARSPESRCTPFYLSGWGREVEFLVHQKPSSQLSLDVMVKRLEGRSSTSGASREKPCFLSGIGLCSSEEGSSFRPRRRLLITAYLHHITLDTAPTGNDLSQGCQLASNSAKYKLTCAENSA